MRSIRSYLPTHSDKTVVIQTRVSEAMKRELQREAKKNKWKTSQVIRAAIQKFLDDQKKVN